MVRSESLRETVQPGTIEALIADLGSSDGMTRERARLALVEMGTPAVGPLINALVVRNNPTYWESDISRQQVYLKKILSTSTTSRRIRTSSGVGAGVSTASVISRSKPVSSATALGVRPG